MPCQVLRPDREQICIIIIKMLYFSKSNKFLFLTDLGEIKALFLVLLVYLNIFFFLYPDYMLLIIHNIILYIF